MSRVRVPTPPSPLPNNDRELVIVANAALTKYIIGQVFALAEAKAWEQSIGGITPQDAADAINEMTLTYGC